jgi:hypothetical protein
MSNMRRNEMPQGLPAAPVLSSTAAQAFAAVIGTYGPDPLVTFHLKRLLGGEAGTTLVLHSTTPAMF